MLLLLPALFEPVLHHPQHGEQAQLKETPRRLLECRIVLYSLHVMVNQVTPTRLGVLCRQGYASLPFH